MRQDETLNIQGDKFVSYNSYGKREKANWRRADLMHLDEMLQLNGLENVPKDEFVVFVEDRYVFRNKIDPFSSAAMGVRMGLFTFEQVICVNFTQKQMLQNKAAQKLGIRNIKGDLLDILKTLGLAEKKIRWVSADLMKTPRRLADYTGNIMETLAKQKTEAGLFANYTMRDNMFSEKEVEGSPSYYLKNFSSKVRFQVSGYGSWSEEKSKWAETSHVTSKMPMQCALYFKRECEIDSKPEFDFSDSSLSKREMGAKKAWVTMRVREWKEWNKVRENQEENLEKVA